MNEFNQTILQLLNEIKQSMQQIDIWQSMPPAPEAFLSEQPFAVDTMSGHEWLQWIFLPRMNALIEAKAELPRNFSIHPYFEEVFKEQEEAQRLLSLLKRLDHVVKE